MKVYRVILLALLVLPSAVRAQPAPLLGLDTYVLDAMRAWEVPGLALAVVRNDSVIYARGYGVRELGRAGAVDEHTLFAIASTTKAFTVGALGMLVDERKLRWDDRVTQHLPTFALSDMYITHQLTVRDLLTHRSGIARSDNLWIAAPFDRNEVVRRARYLPAQGTFRADYGYHNVMFTTAGEVVTAVSGMSWDDFLAERIFQPLGMTRSTTRASVIETRDNVAASHTRVDGRVAAVPRRNYDNIGGAGAAFSSVTDMTRWIRLHLNGGVVDGKRLLAAATVREMHTPQTIMRSDTAADRMFPNTHFRAYGLGWFLQDYHGRKLVHHSGSINWTRTQVMMVPSERIGVVAIANYGNSNLQLALTYRIIDALLGLPARDWSAEYLANAKRADERSAVTARETEAARVANTKPSLALAEYAGRYVSELYGDVELALEHGRLVLRYAPDYIADLEHWHHDTFRGTWRRAGFGRAFITFTLDRRGRTATLDLDGFGEFRRR